LIMPEIIMIGFSSLRFNLCQGGLKFKLIGKSGHALINLTLTLLISFFVDQKAELGKIDQIQ